MRVYSAEDRLHLRFTRCIDDFVEEAIARLVQYIYFFMIEVLPLFRLKQNIFQMNIGTWVSFENAGYVLFPEPSQISRIQDRYQLLRPILD